MSSIKPVDTVRTAADLQAADLEGLEGRWLDVPRLQQLNGQHQSGVWCGRTSAAMVYNYYCKAAGKTDQYIGHDDGAVGPGQNGIAFNLRFAGGPHSGKIAGISESGLCYPVGIWESSGWSSDSGRLSVADDPSESDLAGIYARHIDQLKKNNPIVQYTQLTENHGHIVVINGYKLSTTRGELWLRIVDPCYPHTKLIGASNLEIVTSPVAPDRKFSEYWIKARRLLEIYPKRQTRLYHHRDNPGHFAYAIPHAKVKDDSELVHKLTLGAGATAAAPAGSAAADPAGSAAADPAGPPKEKGSKAAKGSAAGGGGGGEAASGAKAQPAAAPPKTGSTRLPVAFGDSPLVNAQSIAALYHLTERGLGGFFPLGDSAMFHCGAHLIVPTDSKVLAVADGEVVAARLGASPGEHPWGDTGFVILRHPTKDDKNLYSLVLHLRREALHPDRASSPWLKRLLTFAMTPKGTEKKPKWRVLVPLPGWKDEDKGNFTRANVQNDVKLPIGIYDEEDEQVIDHRHYLKLQGNWILADEETVKELSAWSDFDLDTAARNSPIVKALVDGKVAVFDADKDADGKRQWKVLAGEVIGRAGWYLGSSSIHWSMFSKEPVFPSGALGDEEFKAEEPVKLADLDLSSKDHGTVEHAKALITAIDPKNEHLGAKKDDAVIEPGELRHFYRTPSQCWRGRYQAVKALADFKLDLGKLVAQDRYKSHSPAERKEFTRQGKAFLFWDELSAAEEFPTDGVAIFVHPVTGLRLMSEVAVQQDHDDPPDDEAPPGKDAGDRLHAEEDVLLCLRDSKGPIAAADVTVKADGKIIHQGKTDAQGELLLKLEEVSGQELEVSVDPGVVGDSGLLVEVINETGAPTTLMPGATANQTINGTDSVPEHRMDLRMRVKSGQTAKWFTSWDEQALEPRGDGGSLEEGAVLNAERFVFRRDDGQFELVQTHLGGQLAYLWSIEKGAERVEQFPEEHQDKKGDPHLIATWSRPIAHQSDHPLVAGRVQNIADGTELDISFFAVMALGAPEHDVPLKTGKAKVAAGGFSVGLDPHVLSVDSNLLSTPRAVYAVLKNGDHEFSLRDQLLTVYAGEELAEQPPRLPAIQAASVAVLAVSQIAASSGTAKIALSDKSAAETRTLSQLTGPAAAACKGEPTAIVYAGAAAPGMHRAVDGEAGMSPADALLHQQQANLTALPDAPGWLFAPAVTAWSAANGIALALCASDCKAGVSDQGLQSGCSDEIRQKNLGACHLAHLDACKDAAQLGTDGGVSLKVLSVDHCGGSLLACGSAEHDKSKCYLTRTVTGDNAEERERYFISLALDQAQGFAPGQLRVAVVNPKNGAVVVCSQEDATGPSASSDGHGDCPEAAIDADAFKGKPRLAEVSMEAAWKLGLPNHGEDAPVLLLFVPLTVPLGPLLPGTLLEVSAEASLEQLQGRAPVQGAST